MSPLEAFLREHTSLTRRYFLKTGAHGAAAALAGGALISTRAAAEDGGEEHGEDGKRVRDPRLQKALDALESWLTPPDDFRDVSRGNPKPHSLSDEDRERVGLTRDTWQLEVIADPEHPARLRQPLSKEDGTALTFSNLMELAKEHAVRFPKIMTCLNLGCPLGNGIWEGVPLRHVLWKTQPRDNLRRVFYYGYHNDDPKQEFRSSLPVGRVLEDPFDLPPVILCYKLNGQWLTPERGGPVRVVVPEAYGFKNIKWLTRVFLSNLFYANDTYGEKNNDVDSPLKTFCATISAPRRRKADEPFALSGYAQVGISGLKKVQVSVASKDQSFADDPHFTTAKWIDAKILAPPRQWGGGLPDNTIPQPTLGFDHHGAPTAWPLRLSLAHWALTLPGLPAGEYTIRCRTIDAKGKAQPMPRPFRKSGHAAIEQLALTIE